MAYYKYLTHLSKYDGDIFDAFHEPGEAVTFPGIYRCGGCGREITHTTGSKLPPQDHHQHTPAQGGIRWQLLVWSVG